MSTVSNNCNRGSTTSQKHSIVFITPSTLSTAINKCQHMSTKALASNSSVKGYYLRVCWLSKPHQQRQQTATTATEEEQNFTETWHCLCNTINTVNSHQHKSTPVNKGFSQKKSMKGHYPGVCCLLKPHQQCQQTATTATGVRQLHRFMGLFLYQCQHCQQPSTQVNTCQQRL